MPVIVEELAPKSIFFCIWSSQKINHLIPFSQFLCKQRNLQTYSWDKWRIDANSLYGDNGLDAWSVVENTDFIV